jgi:enoyl-CoA hydratase
MSEEQLVRVDRDGEIAVVTVDRVEKMNALNEMVIRQIGTAFDSLRDDADVLGVILTGAGEKAFVAGADIGELAEMTPTTGVATSRLGQQVFGAIERFPKPVVAAIGGYALGGGFELALACHVRIAGSNARFGLPEVSLGIIPGYGGTVRLARLTGLGRAIELTLTGEMFDAERALEMGVVTHVVERGELMEQATALLRSMTKNGPVALRLALESIYSALDANTRQAMDHEAALFGVLASTADMKEGMTAFLEKRKAKFRGV